MLPNTAIVVLCLFWDVWRIFGILWWASRVKGVVSFCISGCMLVFLWFRVGLIFMNILYHSLGLGIYLLVWMDFLFSMGWNFIFVIIILMIIVIRFLDFILLKYWCVYEFWWAVIVYIWIDLSSVVFCLYRWNDWFVLCVLFDLSIFFILIIVFGVIVL